MTRYDAWPRSNCRGFGTRLLRHRRPPEAVVADADYVYTSLWWWEDSAEYVAEVRRKMQPYQVNAELWAKTKPGARFMHCLPAVRGDEVTDEIIDGPASMVWDMAENRKHLQKAVRAGPDRHRPPARATPTCRRSAARCCREISRGEQHEGGRETKGSSVGRPARPRFLASSGTVEVSWTRPVAMSGRRSGQAGVG